MSDLLRRLLIAAGSLVTLTVIYIHRPLCADAASKLAGAKKVVYVASALSFTIAGPADWYGAVQAEGPNGRLAYPGWPPTRRAMYAKYGDEEAAKRAFNPTLVIELMDAESKSALDYLTYNLNVSRAEPGISVLEAPIERAIGGRKWATCRLRVLMGNNKSDPVVIQQWYATVHRSALVLVIGGSTEQEFGEDGALFDRTAETAAFGPAE